MGTLMDYAELAVQFGYITLFVVAFPLAPFLALANNYVEFRSDAFKLLTQMRRPVPRGCEDIGSWQGVFTAISCIAVVTNSALVRIAIQLTPSRPNDDTCWADSGDDERIKLLIPLPELCRRGATYRRFGVPFIPPPTAASRRRRRGLSLFCATNRRDSREQPAVCGRPARTAVCRVV